MNEELIKFLKKGINEDKLSHAFLVESNNIEETILKIYNIFVETKAIPNIKIENNLSVMLIKDENNIISQEKIIQLQKYVLTKNQNSKYKIYFIYDGIYMNKISANKLLKTIEEPPENTICFIITSSVNEILETIKSRCLIFSDKSKTETKNYEEIIKHLDNNIYASYYELLKIKKELKKYEKQELISLFSEYAAYLTKQPITINLAKKYKIIDNILELIKSNVNIELCLDKFLIEMEKLK